MNTRVDRQIPKRYVARFAKAITAEMGTYSLRMILRDAGLQGGDDQAPHILTPGTLRASEFAAIHSAVRAYYGSGARGSLNRIGRLVWQAAIAKTAKGWLSYPIARGLLSRLAGSRFALNMLATMMKKPDGDVSVHLFDTDLIFMDTSSDATYGQEEDQPICWYTVGLIQACIFWATGQEMAVDEIACRAMGVDACKFKIDI